MSAFQLLNRFAHNEDINPVLEAYAGFNVLRVWPYTPAKNWGEAAWEPASHEDTILFLDICELAGFYVELTLLTDDDPLRIVWAADLLRALAVARPPNLLIEIGNEPTTHKRIDTAALRGACEAAGFLFSSGDYEDSTRFFGRYLTAHTDRDAEWPRRAHDLLEYYGGGGPHDPADPAHRVPCVADEPIRPDQAGYAADDFLAYFGACALLGAGATIHTDTGKFGLPPTEAERPCIAAALEGLTAFPADAPNGPYSRPGDATLRTYTVGPYTVRIRPQVGPILITG